MKPAVTVAVLALALVSLTGSAERGGGGGKGGGGGRGRGSTVAVQKESIESRVTVGGAVVANRTTVVTAPYAGYVTKIFVTVGKKVKRGDPLLLFTQTLRGVGEEANPMRAPFDGMVTQLLHEEGEYVEQNKDSSGLVRLDDPSVLFVNCDIAETDLTKLQVGQEALIRVNALPDNNYKGKIERIALSAKIQSQSGRFGERVEFPIRIRILDADEKLRPGYSALIDVVTDKRTATLTLPHEYLDSERGAYFVTLASGERKTVRVGLENAERVELIEGVSEGDQVRLVDFTEERAS